MADLTTLANIAEILGTVTIVGGAIFAVLQIREFRAQRRETVAVELMRSFQQPALAVERESAGKESHPAYERHADWRPRD